MTKPLPDNKTLNLLWAVATSTSIETDTKPHIHFAKLLYNELNGIEALVGLADE